MSTPKQPAAPMNGRWLNNEPILKGDRFKTFDGTHHITGDVGDSGINPEFDTDGEYHGYFRPGKPTPKPKAKTRTWWVFAFTIGESKELTGRGSRSEARERRNYMRSLKYICGPVVKVEVPTS